MSVLYASHAKTFFVLRMLELLSSLWRVIFLIRAWGLFLAACVRVCNLSRLSGSEQNLLPPTVLQEEAATWDKSPLTCNVASYDSDTELLYWYLCVWKRSYYSLAVTTPQFLVIAWCHLGNIYISHNVINYRVEKPLLSNDLTILGKLFLLQC